MERTAAPMIPASFVRPARNSLQPALLRLCDFLGIRSFFRKCSIVIQVCGICICSYRSLLCRRRVFCRFDDAQAHFLRSYFRANYHSQRIFLRRIKSLSLQDFPGVIMSERSDGSGTIVFGPQNPLAQSFPAGWPGRSQYVTPTFEMIGRAKETYDLIIKAEKSARSRACGEAGSDVELPGFFLPGNQKWGRQHEEAPEVFI